MGNMESARKRNGTELRGIRALISAFQTLSIIHCVFIRGRTVHSLLTTLRDLSTWFEKISKEKVLNLLHNAIEVFKNGTVFRFSIYYSE